MAFKNIYLRNLRFGIALFLISLPISAPIFVFAKTPPASQPTIQITQKSPQYNLRQLVEMARNFYPGVQAARYAISAMEEQVFRARWAWLPQGNVRGLVAAAPSIDCFNEKGERDMNSCVQTSSFDVNSFKVGGILARIELEFGMPLYTFDKIGAAKRAAASGVEIRKAQLTASEDKLDLDVTKAYWGLKLAREILYTIREGQSYLIDAENMIQKDIDEEGGEYTVSDLLRLKTSKAEVDIRLLEARKLEQLTLAALSTLVGKQDPSFDVDTEILDVIPGTPLPLKSYLELAQQHRPEIKLLEAAVRARNAAIDLERARFFPDFLLVGMVGYAFTSSVDDPKNAFYNDPFNFMTAGFGLAMTWRFDQVQQIGQFRMAKAKAKETEARRFEALAGINLEIQKAWVDLDEASSRRETSAKGEKTARTWLVATSQNLLTGLAEPKDLIEALLAFFQLRLRHLQAMYDVNVGWSELGRVIGTSPERQHLKTKN